MVPKLTQICHGERKDRRRNDTDWVLQYWEEETRVGISVVCWVFNLIWCSSRGLYKIGKYVPIYSIIYFKCFHKYFYCFPMPRKSTVLHICLADSVRYFLLSFSSTENISRMRKYIMDRERDVDRPFYFYLFFKIMKNNTLHLTICLCPNISKKSILNNHWLWNICSFFFKSLYTWIWTIQVYVYTAHPVLS